MTASTRVFRGAIVLAAALLLVAQVAHAEAGPLDRLVADYRARLAGALKARQPASLDVALVVRAERGFSVELAAVVSRLLVSGLKEAGFRSVQQIAPGDADTVLRRARRAGFELLLDCTLSLRQHLLHLRGELRDLGGALWAELMQPERGSLAHLHAQVRVDAEVRAFQRGKGPSRWRFALTRFGCPICPLLALATADLDGDGRDELVALHPHELAVLTFSGDAKGFSVRVAAALPGPPPAVGARRPVGSIVVVRRSDSSAEELLLRTSARATSFRVGLKAGKLNVAAAAGAGFPLGLLRGADGRLDRLAGELEEGTDRFVAATTTLGGRAIEQPQRGRLPAAFYRLKVAGGVGAPAAERLVGVVGVDGQLSLLDQRLARVLASLQTVGLAFTLGDIDGDGSWDLVSSSAGAPDGQDELSVHRLEREGQSGLLRHSLAWRNREVGGIVSALTHGDFDGDGRVEVIAAVEKGGGKCVLLQLN